MPTFNQLVRKGRQTTVKKSFALQAYHPNNYKFKSIPFYASPVMHGFYLSDS